MYFFLLCVYICLLIRICGCGSGESGCSACGCCKACARELDGQEARQRGIFDAVKEMIPLDLLLGTPTDILTHVPHVLLRHPYNIYISSLSLRPLFTFLLQTRKPDKLHACLNLKHLPLAYTHTWCWYSSFSWLTALWSLHDWSE